MPATPPPRSTRRSNKTRQHAAIAALLRAQAHTTADRFGTPHHVGLWVPRKDVPTSAAPQRGRMMLWNRLLVVVVERHRGQPGASDKAHTQRCPCLDPYGGACRSIAGGTSGVPKLCCRCMHMAGRVLPGVFLPGKCDMVQPVKGCNKKSVKQCLWSIWQVLSGHKRFGHLVHDGCRSTAQRTQRHAVGVQVGMRNVVCYMWWRKMVQNENNASCASCLAAR